MPNIADFYDDFATISLDESKWPAWQGDVTTLAGGGISLGRGSAANAYSIVSSGSDTNYDMRNGSAMVRVDTAATGGSADSSFYLIRNGNGRLYGFGVSENMLYFQTRATDAGAVQNLGSVPYNLAEHRWWRFRHSTSTNKFIWQTSRDGESWVTRHTVDTTGRTFTDMHVEFAAGYWDTAQPGSGRMTLGYFNTRTAINRGPGYLTESFDQLRSGVIPYGVAWGPLRILDDGGGSNVNVMESANSGKHLSINVPDTALGIVRTDLKQKIRDVDITVDVTFTGQAAAVPNEYDAPFILWRVQGDAGAATRYQLQIGVDYMFIQRVDNNVTTTLQYIGIGNVFGVTYRFRIVHAGATIVVYRDAGDFLTTGFMSKVTEVARTEDNVINTAGHVGFMNYSSGALFDNLSIAPGVTPALPRRTLPIRRRTWGAFVAAGDYTTPPVSMIFNTQYLTDMENMLGREFEIASWFLDDNALFPLKEAIELTDGGRRRNLVSWGPAGWDFAAILAGQYDSILIDLAHDMAQLPSVTYFRILPEMNGSWAGWSVAFDPATNGVDPARSCNVQSHAQFRQVWRYMVDLFRANGATRQKVRFVFCINESDEPRFDQFEWYYPGSQYVDVLAFDAYNWGTGSPFTWRTHAGVYSDPYNRLAGLDATLPIWATETSSKEPTKDDGRAGFTPVPGRSPIDPAHSKGQWVHDLLNDTGFPRLEAVVWFHIDKERDWRFDSSEASKMAFIDDFAAPLAPGDYVADPESDPQPARPGWLPSTLDVQYEYMRLEEGDAAPLHLLPSRGGLWLTDFDLGFPVTHESTIDRPLVGGTVDMTRLHGSKPVSLGLVAVPYSGIDVGFQQDLVARWMRPDRRPVLVYKPRGGEERRLILAPRQVSAPVATDDVDVTFLQLQFVAPEGYASSTAQRYVAVPGNGTPAEAVTYGSGTALPVIRVYGPCTDPVIYNDTLDGEGRARLGLTMTIAEGQFVEIDVARRTVQLNGWTDESASRRAVLTTSRWFGIQPFRNTLRLVTNGNTGSADVLWRDAWTL